MISKAEIRARLLDEAAKGALVAFKLPLPGEPIMQVSRDMVDDAMQQINGMTRTQRLMIMYSVARKLFEVGGIFASDKPQMTEEQGGKFAVDAVIWFANELIHGKGEAYLIKPMSSEELADVTKGSTEQ